MMSQHAWKLRQISFSLILTLVSWPSLLCAQFAGELPAPASTAPAPTTTSTPVATPQAGEINVIEVRIEGATPNTVIGKLPKLQTRASTPFDPKLIEDDVRALDRTRRFLDIRPRYQYVNNGLVVIFQVVEKPILRYVKFIGMKKVKESKLKKESGLEVGDALDLHKIEEARRTMENYYHENGYPDATVEIREGNKVGDRGAVFYISEGIKQTYWSTEFEGNTIASDSRLRTQIDSKPGILWLFGGEVDNQKIQNDVEKLTAYYRSLGFFQAKIGRILEPDEDGWMVLRFVINEGPRYKVRNVTTIGNTKFTQEQLLKDAQIKANEFYDQPKLDADTMKLRDQYGGEGHIYCDVQPDTRFAEEPGQLDIVFRISEGAIYRVGQIKVDINGESPHTRQRTVMNRMSLRPGDIVDTRKIRADEIRLKRSQLFQNDPSKGAPPRIVISAPQGADEKNKELAQRGIPSNSKPRFQSPDGYPAAIYVDVIVQGNIDEQGPWQAAEQSQFWQQLEAQQPAPVVPAMNLPLQVPEFPRRSIAPSTNAPAALPMVREYPTQLDRPGINSPTPSKPEPMPLQRTQPTTMTGPQVHLVRYTPDSSLPLQRDEQQSAAARADAPRLSGPLPAPQLATPTTSMRPVSQVTAKPANLPLVRLQSPDVFQSVPGAIGPAPGYVQQPQNYATTAQFNQPLPSPDIYGIQPVQYQQPVAQNQPSTQFQQQQVYQPQQPVYQQQPVNGGGYIPADPAPVFGAPPVLNNPATSGIAPSAEVIPPGTNYPGQALPGSPPPMVVNPTQEFGPNGWVNDPNGYVDLNGVVTEGQTGRLMFGVGVNSNAGVVGNIVLDEQNFDIRRWPRSWADVWSGQAWRGAGQRFRLEAAPGSQVSRYTASFTEPYLFDTPISFSTSGFYFQRQYRDWFEERVGGRFGLGYQLPYRPDYAISGKFRIENIGISNPRTPTPTELQEVLGNNDLYGFALGLTHDTRDSPFLPTEGWYSQYEVEYVTGSFDYPRATAELRKYFTLNQRPDGSGRHVLSIGADLGITGPNTPIYDNFYAGGFSTLRGFRFRGASPRNNNVIVGGELQLLGTTEYMFPITADDGLRGVVFCDFGTVEESTSVDMHNFRVAPGFGMRISVAAMGPAPIAIDFAFPIADATGDQQQVFTFFIGLGR